MHIHRVRNENRIRDERLGTERLSHEAGWTDSQRFVEHQHWMV